MNIPEQLSSMNGSNYKQYLDRMAKSSFFSTKQNIPPIITSYKCKTVLDIGCADGSFSNRIAEETGAKVTGLDINSKSIELAKEKFPNLEFIHSDINHLDKNRKFDCIVFCSVMHEISSYFPHEEYRYMKFPIKNAISEAEKHLNPGGILIIRDSVRHPSLINGGLIEHVEFSNEEYRDMFIKFMENDFKPVQKANKFDYTFTYRKGKTDFDFLVCEELLLEFLMVATWGKESWDREVKEKKLICTKNDWFQFLTKNNFKINSYTQTNEEYPKYCRKIYKIIPPYDWVMPEMVCLIVAQKE